jgi:hypothetical protein
MDESRHASRIASWSLPIDLHPIVGGRSCFGRTDHVHVYGVQAESRQPSPHYRHQVKRCCESRRPLAPHGGLPKAFHKVARNYLGDVVLFIAATTMSDHAICNVSIVYVYETSVFAEADWVS